METHRLKMRIGEHELDVEGPLDVVQDYVATFKELVTAIPSKTIVRSDRELTDEPSPDDNDRGGAAEPATESANPNLGEIMNVEDRVVSLTARPDKVADAILLILLGQEALRTNNSVTGAEVMRGIQMTGGYRIGRVDGFLGRAARSGDVVIAGEGRRKRYRLTNQGRSKARSIAQKRIEEVS